MLYPIPASIVSRALQASEPVEYIITRRTSPDASTLCGYILATSPAEAVAEAALRWGLGDYSATPPAATSGGDDCRRCVRCGCLLSLTEARECWTCKGMRHAEPWLIMP